MECVCGISQGVVFWIELQFATHGMKSNDMRWEWMSRVGWDPPLATERLKWVTLRG